jgi:hypothetical protein
MRAFAVLHEGTTAAKADAARTTVDKIDFEENIATDG